MTIAVAVWSQILVPGKEETVVPIDDIHITNAALGEELADSNGRTIIKLAYTRSAEPEDSEDSDDEAETEEFTTILCSLTPGKLEQTTTNLILAKDEKYTFNLVGKNKVYLTGNVVFQGGVDNPPFDDDSELGSGEYPFDEVSDVELEDEELESDASRFEEIVDDEDKKGAKRPRPIDGMDDVKQKGHKKQKNKDGKAVPTSTKASTKELEKEEGTKLEKKEKEQKEKKEKKKDKKEKESGADTKQAEKKPVERELPGGLKFTDHKIGTGPMAKKGNSVAVRYVGKLLNGKQFDSNTKGKPFWLKLGRGEVIKGWEDGLIGMQAGGERVLVVPPALAYGNKPQGPIPAGSTLHFEVKLLQVK